MRFPEFVGGRPVLTILALAALAWPASAFAATITWVGGSFNHSWHNAANWNLARVPTTGDFVVIPNLAGTPAVTFSSGTTTINGMDCDESFNINGGSLTLANNTSNIDGPFTMFAGTLTTGTLLDLTNSVGWTMGTIAASSTGTLRFSGSSSRTILASPVLDVDGRVEFTNGATTLGPGMTLDISGTLSMISPATVTINQDATIGSLDFNSSTLDGSGNLLLTGTSTWRAGTMGGTGATTVGPMGVLNYSPDIPGATVARHLYNEGLVNCFGSINVTVTGSGVIKNRAGGTIRLHSFTGFTGSGVVNNQAGGLIEKIVSSVSTGIDAPLLNDIGAEIRVSTGTLRFDTAVTNNGLIHALPGTRLLFRSGPNVLSATSTLDVDNVVDFTIGTTTIDAGATVSVSDSLRLIKTGILTGTLNLAANIAVPFYEQAGGTLQGSGSLTVNSGLLWTGGLMDGAGSTILAPSSVNNILVNVVSGNIQLNRLLVNQGTCFYDGPFTMTIQSSGIFRNASGGVFNIPVEADIVSSGFFDNQVGALLFKYGGSGVSSITGLVTNNGTIKVTTGTLHIVNTFTSISGAGVLVAGTYDLSTRLKIQGANIVTNAATIILSGTFAEIVNESDVNALTGLTTNSGYGSLTLKNGHVLTVTPSFTNAGTLTLGQGGTGQLIANAGFLQSAGTTMLQNGTLTSSSLVRIQGGSLTGVGTVAGTLQNDALVAPGYSPGGINVLDNYIQTGTGQFEAEIGGTVSGSTYDNLSVGGTASLGGSLVVSLVNGFIPTAGQSFQVITASSRSGAFASDNLPLPAGPGCLEAIYLSNAVSIQALPGVSISAHPESEEVCAGSPVTFFVTATGDGLGYQWRKDTVDIGGANASSYTIPSVGPGDIGDYDVVVSSSCGSLISQEATLTLCVSGVEELPEAGIERLAIGYPSPNPAPGPVTLHFSLPRQSAVSIDVVDIAGRRVATVLDAPEMPRGHHEVRWNGLGASGNPVPSGFYFLAVRTEGSVVTRKVMIGR